MLVGTMSRHKVVHNMKLWRGMLVVAVVCLWDMWMMELTHLLIVTQL